jgi:hypothetical protein
MKNIAKFLAPFAILTFLGSLMISSIFLLVVILSSTGSDEGLPMSYLLRLGLPALSIAMPLVGMIFLGVIMLGFRTPAKVVSPARVENVTESVLSEKENEEHLPIAA